MSARERVVVAMSGGVDSSVAAALLAEDPRFEVVGVTLRFWPCEEGSTTEASCCGIDGVAAARDVAGALDVPHHVFDVRDAFEQQVLAPAWREYARGRTPNPCVLCNAAIKFGLLRQRAERLGARRVATGHHARTERDEQGAVRLLRGRDTDKDQSYFLFALTPDQLAATLFPVGRLTKAEVRAEARRRGLASAERGESQDACLGGGEQGFAEALRLRFGATSAPVELVDETGRRLGRHDGVHRFTIGQRRGLGVATGTRAYVTAIDAGRRRVEVSSDPTRLSAEGLVARGARWLVPPPGERFDAEVQIRYRHRAVPARIEVDGQGGAVVSFCQPQRAVTPGQAVVFYRDDLLLGGGWIEGPVANEGGSHAE